MTSETYIERTSNWLERIVIGHQLCPFAAKEWKLDSIHFQVSGHQELETALVDFLLECKRLDENQSISTTLLIFPKGFESFDSFLDLMGMADALLLEQGYESVYQCAHFHPDYIFDDTPDEHDAAHFTNRSPYPMLHLLREESLEKILEHYPHPEKIPERNINYAREKGRMFWESILRDC